MSFEYFDTDQWEEKFLGLAMSIKTPLRRDIFNYIYSYPGTISRNIVNDLNYSRSRVLRALRIMREAGIVRAAFDEESYKFRYYINVRNCELFLNQFLYLLDLHPAPENMESFLEVKYKKKDSEKMD